MSAREYALQLINDARTATGLNTVTLDDNRAAQFHAEDMRKNCFLSHWGIDGMKPYMRYTLAGGEQYSAENISGIGYCPADPRRYITKSIKENLDQAMDGLMRSPGHRRNILNPHHLKVGIGISYQRPNLWLAQLFTGDYVKYSAKPRIDEGVLDLSGNTKNGAVVSGGSLGVQIYYDQPLRHLTRGQLHNTTCGVNGRIIASLREPPGPNAYYSTHTFSHSGTQCGDPYDVPADAAAATSYFDVKIGINFLYKHDAVWVTATKWATTNDSFTVSADISDLLAQNGNGIYTILLWGEIDGERIPISQSSIFIPPLKDTQTQVPAQVTPSPTPSPTPVPTATLTPTPTPTILPEIDVRELEDLTHELINVQRMMHGVDPLEHVEAIRLIARSHSEDMASRDYFSHDTPEGLDPTDRAESAGYDCRKDYGSYYTFGLAENIHQGWLFARYQIVDGKTTPHGVYSPEELAQNAVQGWMNSPGHRESILDSSFDRAGMGIAITDDGKAFFTQNFC